MFQFAELEMEDLAAVSSTTADIEQPAEQLVDKIDNDTAKAVGGLSAVALAEAK